MDYLIPLDQARLLCAALGALGVLSFVATKAAEVLGLLK
jgi:hypothetical protein